MNRLLNVSLVLIFLGSAMYGVDTMSAWAQDDNNRVSMLNHLRSTGRVKIQENALLDSLLLHPLSSKDLNLPSEDKSNIIVTTGYRVRIFSGNNQSQSKTRAYSLEEEIRNKFPELKTYVIFKTPNWRLVAGDFRTSEEAHAKLRELKEAFPNFGREMFIVRDEIELPMR